jgi:hypothetical protein
VQPYVVPERNLAQEALNLALQNGRVNVIKRWKAGKLDTFNVNQKGTPVSKLVIV